MEDLIAIDTETFLIRPGLQAPKMVCYQAYDSTTEQIHLLHGQLDRHAVEELLTSHLDLHLVGHNIAYDLTVLGNEFPELLPKIFKAYKDGRIYDTRIRQKLIFLAQDRLKYDPIQGRRPSHTLEATSKVWCNITMNKASSFRLKYSSLVAVPVEDWPSEALDYALSDAKIPFLIFEKQEIYSHLLLDERNRCRTAFWLNLMAAWGLRTDPKAVDEFEEKVTSEIDSVMEELKPKGLIRPNGARNMAAIKELVYKAYNGKPPLTAKGLELQAAGELSEPKKYASTSAEVLEASNHPDLKKLGSVLSTMTEKSNYLPSLRLGTHKAITPSFNEMLETGRTSSWKPQVQNLPRRPGVRECFVPRQNFVFVFCDYDSLEIRTWGQVCKTLLGFSTIAERYQENPAWDPHSYMGSAILGIPEDEFLSRKADKDKEVLDARQFGKIPNFALPGGMGIKRFLEELQKYGYDVDEAGAYELRDLWRMAFPESGPWFNFGGLQTADDNGIVEQLVSGRIRSGCGYCDFLNSWFQGLAADLATTAGFLISEACYVDRSSPLFGSRIVNFVHDEFILEVPFEHLHEAAMELSRLMCLPQETYCPDVPITAEPAAAERWYKGADPVYKDGKLVLWTP